MTNTLVQVLNPLLHEYLMQNQSTKDRSQEEREGKRESEREGRKEREEKESGRKGQKVLKRMMFRIH